MMEYEIVPKTIDDSIYLVPCSVSHYFWMQKLENRFNQHNISVLFDGFKPFLLLSAHKNEMLTVVRKQ